MITTSTILKAHLASDVTTLALCWKVTRRDAVTAGFTSFSRDLVVDGITYKASTGFTPTAIETSAGLAVDQLEVEAILNDTSITEADLQAGNTIMPRLRCFWLTTKTSPKANWCCAWARSGKSRCARVCLSRRFGGYPKRSNGK
jgi:uncharacterized phage protein (TIGR02218 family)